jgi:hypothetical protein
MKQYSAIISVVAAAAVLAAAWGIGHYIREVRLRRAGAVSSPKIAQPDTKPGPERPTPGPGGPARKPELSAEQKAQLKEQRGAMIEKSQNMSEQDKEKFRAQVREKFAPGSRADRQGFLQMPPEEMAKLKEQFEKIKEKWESMSEQEKEQFKIQMRERFGAGPQMERPTSPDVPPEGAVPPAEAVEKTTEHESVPEEQK